MVNGGGMVNGERWGNDEQWANESVTVREGSRGESDGIVCVGESPNPTTHMAHTHRQPTTASAHHHQRTSLRCYDIDGYRRLRTVTPYLHTDFPVPVCVE